MILRRAFPTALLGSFLGKRIERDFLFYLFSALKPVLLSEAPVNTQGNLNIERIGSKENLIPVPPNSEQQDIAAFLDEVVARIDALLTKVHDAIEPLKELLTALISAAVTGKIDVRETAA